VLLSAAFGLWRERDAMSGLSSARSRLGRFWLRLLFLAFSWLCDGEHTPNLGRLFRIGIGARLGL